VTIGRPLDPLTEFRISLLEKYGIRVNRRKIHTLTVRLMDQLANCKDEESRRLLLGVSK
jgi:hypothetical protein